MIRRLLVANRGEIARRIIRTARGMGIRTIAVYSDADADAPFVVAADDAIRIGPPPAGESYLNADAILAAAAATHADAIHPGYGFLSEQADFAGACAARQLIFVGPDASMIRQLGSKTGARDVARAVGVPVVPGITPAGQRDSDLAAAIRSVGYPSILKATFGGGGRGMRLIRSDDEIADAVSAARREAARAFGDGTLYVERLIERGRHIEVQVIGDRSGRLIHLFERDCTLQRRHQKVVEEAPATTVSDAVRARLHDAALAIARHAGYVNAGTLEFLVEGDGPDAAFYFLEMNTRLQVEHPVTEAITGLDLVRLQLIVAAGEPLPLRQEDVHVDGHAIEARVCAEDSRRLLPQEGMIRRYREPSGDGIRVDGGVVSGQRLGLEYDSLMAKLVVHARSRETARDRVLTALEQFEILGLRHNIAFLMALVRRPEFQSGSLYTRFIDDRLTELTGRPNPEIELAAAAAAVVASLPPETPVDAAVDRIDPWASLGRVSW